MNRVGEHNTHYNQASDAIPRSWSQKSHISVVGIEEIPPKSTTNPPGQTTQETTRPTKTHEQSRKASNTPTEVNGMHRNFVCAICTLVQAAAEMPPPGRAAAAPFRLPEVGAVDESAHAGSQKLNTPSVLLLCIAPWTNAISVYGVAVVSSFDFVVILQVCFPDNPFCHNGRPDYCQSPPDGHRGSCALSDVLLSFIFF